MICFWYQRQKPCSDTVNQNKRNLVSALLSRLFRSERLMTNLPNQRSYCSFPLDIPTVSVALFAEKPLRCANISGSEKKQKEPSARSTATDSTGILYLGTEVQRDCAGRSEQKENGRERTDVKALTYS